jgi:hypothetical protein
MACAAFCGASALAGCGGPAELLDLPAADEAPPVEAGAAFEPKDAGSIQGRVTWEGAPPAVPPFRAAVSPSGERALGPKRDRPNPHAPVIDQRTHGVAGAVVFLKGVEPRRGRPWDQPPVRVEVRDLQFHVRQGDADARTGFVRRGDAVEFTSAEDFLQLVRVRGAAFFALALPDPGQPRSRRLPTAGVVELSSASGQFWMSGHLFVSDHPYYTRTAADGSFTLAQIPPGDYQLVCWLPDWRTAAQELDADTWQPTRLTWRPPLEKARPIRISRGETLPAWFTASEADFGR